MTQEEKSRLLRSLSYDPKTGYFTWLVAPTNSVMPGDQAGNVRPDGYVVISLGGKKNYGHRLAFLFMTGAMPANVDHCDGNHGNNRWENLRQASHQENMQNLRGPKAHNTCGHLGVYRRGEKFRAKIVVNKKQIQLGTYDTAEEAGVAHIEAKRRLHAGNLL